MQYVVFPIAQMEIDDWVQEYKHFKHIRQAVEGRKVKGL